MANYYWVGGSGTWDASDTTNWASSSGGAGGAGVPTSSDNAYFDGSSDTGSGFTVTIGTGAVCADVIIGDGTTVSVLDQTMTLAGSGFWNVYGSIYYPATNLTRTFSGVILLLAVSGNHTITTNGVILTSNNSASGALQISGGANYTLGSALQVGSGAGGIGFTSGFLDTANYNVTSGVVRFDGGGSKTLTLGSSTWTVLSTSWLVNDPANTTINAGTSTIIVTSGGTNFVGGGKTYYTLQQNMSSTTPSLSISDANNTFENLTISPAVTTCVIYLTITGNQTITGTFSVQAGQTLFFRRAFIRSSVIGSPITLTVGTNNLVMADFRDIIGAGTADWDGSAQSWGDCGGNSNITFPPSKTVYRIGDGIWPDQWAATSGGSPAADQFPIAQDTMVFDANTVTGTHNIFRRHNLGTLDCSALTSAVTITSDQSPFFYGDFVLDSNVTFTGTSIFNFAGVSTQSITSDGVTITHPLAINSQTFQLVDNLVCSNTVTLNQNTLDLNDQVLTANIFSSNNSNTRSIDFGTGKIVLKGTGVVWTTATNTGFTVAGTPVVDVDNNTATATTVTTGSLSETNAVSFNYISGTYTLTDANSVYRNLDFTGFAGTVPNSVRTLFGGLTLEGGATNSAGGNATTFAATSGTHQITTDGVTVNYPLVFNGNGGTFEFQDALTQASTRAFTITNGTVELLAGATSTVGSFSTTGVDQKVLQSTTPGVQATLSQASGTVDASYLTIKDINATGGATWNAFITSGNVDDGNNTGWDFSSPLGKYIYTRRKNKRILP
jgi:hypothetical protein